MRLQEDARHHPHLSRSVFGMGAGREDYFTVKYEGNSKIDQEELEVRRWTDVRDVPDWKSIYAAAKCGIEYLRNRMSGNFPAGQQNYDCSHMAQVYM